MKYTANVCYNESIEGFGSVVTQVQNLSSKTPFGGVFVILCQNHYRMKKTYLQEAQAHYASTALRDSTLWIYPLFF